MTLNNQVSSLELSKKLRELGVKQESYFAWFDGRATSLNACWEVFPSTESYVVIGTEGTCSAFTTSELGEMLPQNLQPETAAGETTYLQMWRNGEQDLWCVAYKDYMNRQRFTEFADTEADARALCLIYLLENKLISL